MKNQNPLVLPDLAGRIERRPIASLKPAPRNARTHSEDQIGQIMASISRFGFIGHILIEADGTIIAGHGRVEAMKRLGGIEVPVLWVDHLAPHEVRLLRIADNRIAENAGWDGELLAIEFGELGAVDFDLDLTVSGFETAEIDVVIESAEPVPAKADPDDDLPAPGLLVSQPGDLWQIGPHRLLCSNALEPASYARLMVGETARMGFTDPPYNVPIAGHICSRGAGHAEFAMASGEMSDGEFLAFLTGTCRLLAAHSQDGALIYTCMDWRGIGLLLKAGGAAGLDLKNIAVWVKDAAGMGSLYRSAHEMVAVFKSGTAPHVNNVELGKHGRNRSNVWRFPGANGNRRGQKAARAMHPTVKPVGLVADAILDASLRGEIVLDTFAGSGTTLLAAARTGRRGFGLEIEPGYVDTAIRRLQAKTGQPAVLDGLGLTFDELSAAAAAGQVRHG